MTTVIQTGTSDYLVHKYDQGELTEVRDSLSAEEPLEIIVENSMHGERHTVAVTMRTPGHDEELAVGFLASEGMLRAGMVPSVVGMDNEVTLRLEPAAYARIAGEPSLQRHFYVSSSCGVCGRQTLDRLYQLGFQRIQSDVRIAIDTLTSLPDAMRLGQAGFDKSGSLHAAAMFDPKGMAMVVREDIGRHNAVDKVIGSRWLDPGSKVKDVMLMVSGRLSYEIVQKAIAASVPVVCAISGPSDLAVKLAHEFGVTIVGFLRGQRFNVYSYPERIG